MKMFWRVFAVLALTLPVGAYVAGNLVASQSDAPTERQPIVLTEVNASNEPTPSDKKTDKNTTPPKGKPQGPRCDDDDDLDHDDDPCKVQVTPHDVDDGGNSGSGSGGGDDDDGDDDDDDDDGDDDDDDDDDGDDDD